MGCHYCRLHVARGTVNIAVEPECELDIRGSHTAAGCHVIHIGNCYIHFLRDQGTRYETLAALDPAFRVWLRRHAPRLYLLYCLARLWRER